MEILELLLPIGELLVWLFVELMIPLFGALFRGIGWLAVGAYDLARHLAKKVTSPIPKAVARYRDKGSDYVASNVQALTTAARDARSSNTPTTPG